MRCEEARAGYLDGDTSPQVAEHLASCPECRAVSEPLVVLRDSLADPITWVEPPAGLENRIMASVGDAGPAPSPAADRGSLKRWAVSLGTAAVVAAVALSAALLLTRSAAPDWEVTATGASFGEAVSTPVAGWNEPAGTRISVGTSQLPPAPDGYIYELWFSRPGEHISAGTFTGAGDQVELTVAVSRRDYPRVWITLEPLDGDALPSDVVVTDHRPGAT